MLLGSINHVSITVSDLPAAMKFFRPLAEFLGYVPEGRGDGVGASVVVCVSPLTGGAFNIWQAKPEHADRTFEVYEPGLHHVAFNASSREQVDRLAELLPSIGGEITDPPGEYGYAGVGTYYAVYFRGPDGIKFEFVHMSELERLHREADTLDRRLWPHETG